MVGINTAVAGFGLGLAVPVDDTTRAIVGALMSEGRFRRAYLGIGGGSRPLPPRLARELDRRRASRSWMSHPDRLPLRRDCGPEDLIVAVDGNQSPTSAHCSG